MEKVIIMVHKLDNIFQDVIDFENNINNSIKNLNILKLYLITMIDKKL